jgi:Lon protease-like protein
MTTQSSEHAMPMNAQYRGPVDLPSVIPVFPLAGALLLPRGQMPLNIFEPRYLAMIDDALRDGHRLIGMVQPSGARAASAVAPPLYRSAASAASRNWPKAATAAI